MKFQIAPTSAARSNAAGFTLMEVLVSLSIIGVLAAAAIIVMPGFVQQSRADGTIAQTLNTLRLARDRAIGERRNFRVNFDVSSGRIQVLREEISNPVVNPVVTTLVSTTYLESGLKFMQFAGNGDTGDAFGVSGPIAFASTPVMFTSEGTFIDAMGDVLNGTVFLGTPGRRDTARAITIFGPTALLKVWRWNGSKWVE
jgi:type IV fimbrial biogenesis protein FimU